MAENIVKIIEPTIQALGLELWACEVHSQGRHSLLRIYIDRADGTGVSIDDCTAVSREVGAVLDVEDPIKSQYQLEVSSPGVNRVLSTLSHFERYVGSDAKVKLRVSVRDQKQFEGRIEKVEDDCIFFNVENETVGVPLSDIRKCELKIV